MSQLLQMKLLTTAKDAAEVLKQIYIGLKLCLSSVALSCGSFAAS